MHHISFSFANEVFEVTSIISCMEKRRKEEAEGKRKKGQRQAKYLKACEGSIDVKSKLLEFNSKLLECFRF